MKPTHLVLPSLVLGGAFALLFPGAPARAFVLSGEELDLTQRDFRVNNTFADPESNNNLVPDPQFPGRTGAVLAIWKAAVEWGSTLHGDGTGDPVGVNPLGSGGANFDFFFVGEASSPGTSNANIVAVQSSCGGGGVLAYTEVPSADGWRIFFCDENLFADGPAGVGVNQWDIQSSAVYTLGLALGLRASSVNGASMSQTSQMGDTFRRSLHADDIAGIQAIYGVAAAEKPRIVGTEPIGGSIVIHGTGFSPSDNEVWFTRSGFAGAGMSPLLTVAGLPSDGTAIVVTVPAGAGPGDVAVKIPGTAHSALSNAFPTDLVNPSGTITPEPVLGGVSPSTVPSLIPGTAQTVTLSGYRLDLATEVLVDGLPLDPARFTVVDPSTITVDLPQVATAGTHLIGVTGLGSMPQIPIEIVPPADPVLELASGDPFSVVPSSGSLRVRLAGPAGAHLVLRAAPDAPPTLERLLRAPGAADSSLRNGLAAVIPPAGWIELHVPALPDPGPAGADWYGLAFRAEGAVPVPTSNLQTIHLAP